MAQEQEQKNEAVRPADLGRSFEAQSSPSFGGDLGTSFEEHNSSREEYEKEKHRTRRLLMFIGGVLLLLAVGLIIFFKSKPKKGAAPAAGAAAAGGGGRHAQGPATITVDKTYTGDINVYVNALGTVTPLNTVTIYSQITGRVIAVHYHEGQIVKKGDPLVDIDPEPYKATLVQAEGTLAHDQGVLAEAKIDLKRYQDAFAQNAIARQQLEDQEQTVVQDEGTVKADQGTVDYDKVQLAYCHIVAPISGRVGLRLVDPGNTVFSGTGSTLVVMTQLQPITVVFNVSEDDLPQIQAQLKAGKTLEVDAYDRADLKQIAKGKLTSLDNQIDTTTGTLKFRATFANGNLALFPNQFVNARLLVDTLKSAVLVPSAAVQQNGTQAFLYLVKPDPKNEKSVIVSVQNISVLTSNEKVNAVQGVGSGVTIATSGFDRLENGAHAVVQKAAPAAAAPSGSDNGVGASKGPPTPAANGNNANGNKQ
jgi:membrane fusion protein, multidrug efflux system